jgi:glycosyltransferase involved in cell wall biosynthesis
MSVVIPTRDRGHLLLEAVASALSAPVPPLEVIVADDGSKDGSVEAAKLAYPQIRVIDGPFGNAARARNAGAAVARGEVLGFLDSDDVILPGKTDGIVEQLGADAGIALVHGGIEVVDETGAPARALTALHRARFEQGARIGLEYPGLAGFCAMFTSATAIRRASFVAVGGYDEALDAYEDWDLYLRLSLVGRLEYADEAVAGYRIWRGNVAWDRTAQWTIRVAEKHLSSLPPMSPRSTARARYAFTRRIVESYNVLEDARATRRAAVGAARIAPTRALVDAAVWRPLLRSFVPPALRRRPSPAGQQ